VSRRYFGTDGIRGVANAKLSPELAFKVGQAAGRHLVETGQTPRVVVGRDTRRSGPMLEAALAAGFCSAGIDVVPLGVVPTPAVSFVCRHGDYSLGIVISASHNPAPDNGIKLFGHDGRKLPDAVELRIEALMDETWEERPVGAAVGGYAEPNPDNLEPYVQFLVGLVPERLDGLKVAVDGAHGAAHALAPRVFEALGAEVVAMGTSPNGTNINEEGGATKPEAIQKFTVETGSDIGVAFDGDADRAVFSDEKGRLINGDRMMGIWSIARHQKGDLNPPLLVGTVMSNGGFEAYLGSQGVSLERAPVGDKYVSERIAATGALIGGEQSGHIIFPHLAPTGDGLATALELFGTLRSAGRPASAFYDDYSPWPQLLVNVSVQKRDGWESAPKVAAALASAEEKLAGRGRVNVRPSGTQPMIRVMVEADDYGLRDEVAESIVDAMADDLGGTIYSKVDLTYALGD